MVWGHLGSVRWRRHDAIVVVSIGGVGAKFTWPLFW